MRMKASVVVAVVVFVVDDDENNAIEELPCGAIQIIRDTL